MPYAVLITTTARRDYRVVFRIDERAREVLVARIRHRREVYRR